MKKSIWILSLCLLLTGCSGLLERSYSVVEPYTARFWETGAEDTLKAETYQDLINSLLLLVEERAEEGHIRYYGKDAEVAYLLAGAAALEVRKDTMLGSYLLEDITYSRESSETYSTLHYQIRYRTDTEDPDGVMQLRDPQSLTDLLRLALRENHNGLTARFVYDVSAEDVEAVVASLWQELYRAALETEEEMPPEEMPEEETPPEEAPPEPPAETEEPEQPDEPGAEGPEAQPPAEGETPVPPEEPELVYPPCPWEIRWYPARDRVELVEIELR